MNCSFYSFFTKYSMLENYGFLPGLWRTFVHKFIPEVAQEGTFEFLLKQATQDDQEDAVHALLRAILADEEARSCMAVDLNAAISALTTKVIAFGLDKEIQAHFTTLKIATNCYHDLIHQLNDLLQAGKSVIEPFRTTLDLAQSTIVQLRQHKDKVGTSLHLTVATKRTLEYLKRIVLLLELKADLHKMACWDTLIQDYHQYEQQKTSIRRYIKSHTDILALVIVEHTSQSGEQYVASNRREYVDFFKKGLIGGFFISIFALIKIFLDKNYNDPLPSAFVFSLNYAACFVLVKVLGGTIATKQPAMTASTIIRHVDKRNTMRIGTQEDIIALLRKVSCSQFISLLGNFVMAFVLACLLAYSLRFGWTTNPIDADKSAYLLKSVSLISGGAMAYAAVAGIFLALSGLISGYVDNRVLASQLPLRLRQHALLRKISGKQVRESMATFVEKQLGGILGNISLGFFLGSAFLLSYVLPFELDIRHVAFSSANVGYAIVGQAVAGDVLVLALLQVLAIGLVNFLVSFALTFYLALKSRGITARGLGKLLLAGCKDFVRHPLAYFIFREEQPQMNQVK